MRRSNFAILGAFAIVLASASSAFAQSGGRRATLPSQQNPSAVLAAPASPFRPRTTEERLTSLRRVVTEQARRAAPGTRLPMPEMGSGQLGATLILTPRAPFVAQQGSLSAQHAAMLETRDSGVLYFLGDDPPPPGAVFFLGESLVVLDLSHSGANQHLLIECAVDGHSGPYRAQIAGNNVSWSDTSGLFDGHITFLTPVFPGGGLQVRIRPVAVGPTVSWSLTGCEVSYVST